MRYGQEDGAVMVEEDNGYHNFGDSGSGSDDDHDSEEEPSSWTSVQGGGQKSNNGDDLFGPSTGDVDIFASEGTGGGFDTGADFFGSSPSSTNSGASSTASTGGSAQSPGTSDFFADFGSPSTAPPAATSQCGEDFFALAGSPTQSAVGNEDKTTSGSDDFFSGTNSVFSFSSAPAPVGSVVQPTPTPDKDDTPEGISFALISTNCLLSN